MGTAMQLESVAKLRKDLVRAASTLSRGEARFLVDHYYTIQEYRKAASNQVGALGKSEEPHEVIQWLTGQTEQLEGEIKKALGVFSKASRVGRWAESIIGIGPVISAGLLAHIDIEKAPTVGHIWRFAGLDPTVRWGKGEKRPWNAALKVLCWKIGQSFLKQSGHEQCFYGHVLRDRKALEVARNEAGTFAETAARTLQEKNVREPATKATYESGKLPAGRLELRAERYATKLYLAHWHQVAYEVRFGEMPPKPYVVEHLGHAHLIAPPNWPMD